MARPKAKELTERELEIMHAFWQGGESLTVADIQQRLEADGRHLAYTTVATLIRILAEKSFLEQVNEERPYLYRAARSYEDVSRRMLGDLVQRLFGGSRELLLQRLMEQKKLTPREREFLQQILRDKP